MRIAIVGGGVSGLVAARRLQGRHDVTLFEASDRIGGHSNTVEVEVGGRYQAVDTGFIVYNERTYPNFTRLLDELGVETQPSDMSFGVTCEATGLEWSSRGLGAIFAQRRNLLRPPFHRMLRDVLRFNRESPRLLELGDEKVALGDYLCGASYSAEFVRYYVIPMGAAIWSADPATFLRFPAASFVRFLGNHGLLQRKPSVRWRVVSGGSARYVDALAAPFRHRIRTSCPVEAIRRASGGVVLHAAGEPHRFDRVVLAVHSDQALRLLTDPSALELRVLGSIRYQENEALLHTDERVMPRSRRAWASWNYRIPRAERGRVFVTYHMNRLQNLDCPRDLFVTLNGSDHVDPMQVVKRIIYHHPVFDGAAMEAQKHLGILDGDRRTHYCGAYWGYGFHEDGVRSGLAVCRRLGVEG